MNGALGSTTKGSVMSQSRHYPGICLEALSKTTKIVSQGKRSPDGHSNREPPGSSLERCRYINLESETDNKDEYIYIMYLGLYTSLLDLGRFFSFLILSIIGRTLWTGDQPAPRPLPTRRTTQTQSKCTQTYMPWVGFERTDPAFGRAKTVHVLDCAATVIGRIIILLTYLRSWALLEKLSIMQPLKNFTTFYGTRRFITMFTRVLHWSLS
jgi:hypothetical protein